MKDWIINWIVEVILKALSEDKIEHVAQSMQAFIIPFLHEQKDALIFKLKAKASATQTELDDAACHALDVFLGSFIPKPGQCLVPKN